MTYEEWQTLQRVLASRQVAATEEAATELRWIRQALETLVSVVRDRG